MAAVTDFRISVGFITHPKVRRLQERHARGVESLIRLYTFAAVHDPEHGELRNMTAEDVARQLGRGSHYRKLIDDLVELKLLDEIPGGFKIHEWEQHQPWAADIANRSEEAKKNAKKRQAGSTRETSGSSREASEDQKLEVSLSAVFPESSGANPAKRNESASAPILSNLTSPLFSTTTESQEGSGGEEFLRRWRAAFEWWSPTVPPTCPHTDRPGHLRRLVDHLHEQGFPLVKLPASATADVVGRFVQKLTPKSQPVADITAREWQQALNTPHERASTNDFWAEFKGERPHSDQHDRGGAQ